MTIEVERIGHQELKVVEGYPVIVVYESPSDFPGKYVARLCDLRKGQLRLTEIAAVASSLDEIRKRIPVNQMYPVPRLEGDDPCIVETWI
jgi:hypothetical protein